LQNAVTAVGAANALYRATAGSRSSVDALSSQPPGISSLYLTRLRARTRGNDRAFHEGRSHSYSTGESRERKAKLEAALKSGDAKALRECGPLYE
jgi:hypothetical protein